MPAPRHAMVASGLKDAPAHAPRPMAPLPLRFRTLVGTDQSTTEATRQLMHEAQLTLAETADMDVDAQISKAARNFDAVVKEHTLTLAESVRSVLGKRPKPEDEDDEATGETVLPGWTVPKRERLPAIVARNRYMGGDPGEDGSDGEDDQPYDSDEEGEAFDVDQAGDEALDQLLARRAEALQLGANVDAAGERAVSGTKTTASILPPPGVKQRRNANGGLPFIAVDPFAPKRIAKPAIEPTPGVGPAGHLPTARKLVPYAYQVALLDKAKAGNVLAVLETGAGKTLISSLLMEHIEQQRADRETARLDRIAQGSLDEADQQAEEKKLMFFVVNRSARFAVSLVLTLRGVPLVHQQAQLIAANSTLRVGKLHGSLGVDLWSTQEWIWNMTNFDVLVLTAQLLLDALSHGFIAMPQISLLVFDEGHHAKANHPFAAILRWHYARAPVDQRPKVLGMTASPIDSAKAAIGADGTDKSRPSLAAAHALARTFDAEIVTAPLELTGELRKHVHRPTELIVHYDPTPEQASTRLNVAMRAQTGCAEDELYQRFVKAGAELLFELGPHASDLVWQYALVKLQRRLSRLAVSPDEPTDVLLKGVESQHLRLYKMLREEIGSHDFGVPRLTGKHVNVTPKYVALVDVLRCFKDMPSFCGIIFVKRRYSAHILAALLRTTPGLDWLKPAICVGHGVGNKGDSIGVGMAWQNQTAVLEQFRNGSCNLLVATSVVEEGLDVRECNLVIRADPFETHISYIQSRGRARSAGSHYVLMQERGNYKQQSAPDVYNVESALNRFLRRNADGIIDHDEDAVAPADELDEDLWYRNDATGALLTPHVSLSLLMRYTSTLPEGDAFVSRQPVYEVAQTTHTVVDETGAPVAITLYTCELVLPSSCPIRSVRAPPAPTKRQAKRLAAFQACVQLSKLGCLDEHFLPYSRAMRTLEIEQQAVAVEEARKRQAKYAKKVADVWIENIVPLASDAPPSDRTSLFVTALRLVTGGTTDPTTGTFHFDGEPYQPVVLLTRSPLPVAPPIRLWLHGQPVMMQAEAVSDAAIDVDAERLERLFGYTLRCLRAVTNRAFLSTANKMAWFVAPVLSNGGADIDWDAVSIAAAEKEIPLDPYDIDDLSVDSVIVDRANNGARYYFVRTRRDLCPRASFTRYDKLTQTVSPAEGRILDGGFANVLEYYLSFSRAAAQMRVKEDQPLIELRRLPRNLTFLHGTPRNDQTPSRKRLQERLTRLSMPQCCAKLTLPASTLRTLHLVPSAIHLLDHFFLVRELNDKLFDGRLNESQLSIALMAPAAMLGAQNESLELLGDAWLKWATSAILFVCMPSAHEGELHVGRLRIVQNATLYLSALELDLYAYLQTRPFSHRLWAPPNCEAVLSGEEGDRLPTNVHTIGDKTLADVVEALLGVGVNSALLAGGTLDDAFALTMDVATAIQLRFKLKTWADVQRVYASTVPPVVASTGPPREPTALEVQLGHVFADRSILAEALTHPSKLNATSKSYERLEFLGDAVLDMHVLQHAMKRWPALDVGHLTEIKGACVCNEMLAAMSVHFGWHRLLQHDSPALHHHVENYVNKLEAAERAEIEAARAEGREQLKPYWLHLDAPKAVADMVESMLGAVFVDGAFRPTATLRVFDHLIRPFIDTYISPTNVSVDAIRQLLEVAQSHSCGSIDHRATIVEATAALDDPNLPPEYQPRQTRADVVMHGLVVASAIMPNAKTAKRLASAKARDYLLANVDFFLEHCDCAIVRAELKEAAAAEKARRKAEGLDTDDEADDPSAMATLDDEDDDAFCASLALAELD